MSDLTQEERGAIDDLSIRVEAGDYYAILGVAVDCSSGELKKAYYDLSRRFHPDRYYRREVDDLRDRLESVFTGINISFEVLSDKVQRRRFDLERAKKEGGRQSLSQRRSRSSGSRSSAGATAAPTPPTAPTCTQPVAASAVAEGESSPSTPPRDAAVDVESGDSLPRSERQPTKPRRSAYARHRDRLRQSGDRANKERPSRVARQEGAREPSQRSDAKPRGASKMSETVRNKVNERRDKAKACYEDGLKAIEEENWGPAASSLYLAHQYAPNNAGFKSLWEETQAKANQTRSLKFISLAESAESFRNVPEAMHNYQKATECDPEDGLAHFRFGKLLAEHSGDARAALLQFRHAVMKTPNEIKYRMALADLYVTQNMSKNAVREYQKALELDPKNKDAKNALRKLRF
jgi:curved DNA-binding protein CbpA